MATPNRQARRHPRSQPTEAEIAQMRDAQQRAQEQDVGQLIRTLRRSTDLALDNTDGLKQQLDGLVGPDGILQRLQGEHAELTNNLAAADSDTDELVSVLEQLVDSRSAENLDRAKELLARLAPDDPEPLEV